MNMSKIASSLFLLLSSTAQLQAAQPGLTIV